MATIVKLPKGTRDYYGEDFYKMKFLKDTATRIFEKFQGVPLETPSFERTDVLTSKYGEEEKLIFNIESVEDIEPSGKVEEDKSVKKEDVSLRYDMTVPFVRYVISNKLDKGKRYTIGPAYRRETTSAKIVRLRQFYQADFDFVGNYDVNLPEIQIFMMINKFFKDVGITDYTIRYNFRQLLMAYVVDIAGVPKEKFKEVCASLDKLDKRTWEDVESELETVRGLNVEQIASVKKCITEKIVPTGSDIENIITDLNAKFTAFGITNLEFDTSLARGLDYYTGIIFEVNVKGFDSSVCAGGRYDKLINTYDKERDLPMIGFCLGLDRIMEIVDYSPTEMPTVIVFTITQKCDDDTLMKLNEIKTRVISQIMETDYSLDFRLNDKKVRKNLSKIAKDTNYKYAIIIGQKEAESGEVAIKNLIERKQESVKIDDVKDYLSF